MEAFSDPRTLAFPIYDGRAFYIQVDACEIAIGCALLQRTDAGRWRVIAYAGRNFVGTESAMSASEKEMCGVVYAIHQFRDTFEGFQLIVNTDHRPLVALFSKARPTNKKLYQMALTIADVVPSFRNCVEWIPGRDMVVADAISRLDIDPDVDPEGFLADRATPDCVKHINTVGILRTSLAEAQRADPNLAAIIDELEWWGEESSDPVHSMKSGVLYRYTRVLIPSTLVTSFLQAAHGSVLSGHFGINKTSKLLEHVYWHNMTADIHNWVKSCEVCKRIKPAPPMVHPALRQPELADYEPFACVNIDIIGPISPASTQGNKYILTCVCRVSRWVEAFPLPDITALTVANAFIHGFISRHGVPKSILSDRGSNFCSELVAAVNEVLGIQHDVAASYAPFVSGSVERFNGVVMSALNRVVGDNLEQWDMLLPLVLFAIRSTVCRATGVTPARMVYGRELRVPIDTLLCQQLYRPREVVPFSPEMFANEITNTVVANWRAAFAHELHEYHGAEVPVEGGGEADAQPHDFTYENHGDEQVNPVLTMVNSPNTTRKCNLATRYQVGTLVRLFQKKPNQYKKFKREYTGPFVITRLIGNTQATIVAFDVVKREPITTGVELVVHLSNLDLYVERISHEEETMSRALTTRSVLAGPMDPGSTTVSMGIPIQAATTIAATGSAVMGIPRTTSQVIPTSIDMMGTVQKGIAEHKVAPVEMVGGTGPEVATPLSGVAATGRSDDMMSGPTHLGAGRTVIGGGRSPQ